MHDVVVDFSGNAPPRCIREENELDAQEWNQNEGGTDSFHIQTRLSLVCYFQFGDEDSYNVQQKEQVHLEGVAKAKTTDLSWLADHVRCQYSNRFSMLVFFLMY